MESKASMPNSQGVSSNPYRNRINPIIRSDTSFFKDTYSPRIEVQAFLEVSFL